jgi:hypothetical protein
MNVSALAQSLASRKLCQRAAGIAVENEKPYSASELPPGKTALAVGVAEVVALAPGTSVNGPLAELDASSRTKRFGWMPVPPNLICADVPDALSLLRGDVKQADVASATTSMIIQRDEISSFGRNMAQPSSCACSYHL